MSFCNAVAWAYSIRFLYAMGPETSFMQHYCSLKSVRLRKFSRTTACDRILSTHDSQLISSSDIKNLDILTFAGVRHNLELPSWMADWKVSNISFVNRDGFSGRVFLPKWAPSSLLWAREARFGNSSFRYYLWWYERICYIVHYLRLPVSPDTSQDCVSPLAPVSQLVVVVEHRTVSDRSALLLASNWWGFHCQSD